MIGAPSFDPRRWYWIADDGRIFSGPALAAVQSDDTGYEAFLANGNEAAIWPRDDQGGQTISSLQAAFNVLWNRDQVDAVRDARLNAGFADATTGKTFPCDDKSIAKWNAIGSSAGLALALSVTPSPTFELITADNSTVTLSATDAYALLNGRVMPWVSATILYARSMKNDIIAGHAPADLNAGWP